MQKRVEKGLTLTLAAVTVLLVTVLYFFPSLHTFAFYDAPEEGVYSIMNLIRESEDFVSVSNGTVERDFGHQLRLELPSNITKKNVSIGENVLYHTITITIEGVESTYVNNYPIVGSSDGILDLTFGFNGGAGILELTMDAVYVLQTTYEGSYLYLDFSHPGDVYDAVVVVDAGHGGKDGGATSGGAVEKDLNLAIVEKLKSIFDESDYNIGVYYTRLSDFNPEYEARVGLANELDADLFLSVHINSTASGRVSGINGTEVMYRSSDGEGKSKAFAGHCLDALLASLQSNSKGLVAGDEIYIIRSSNVPVALAEIGFMTNKDELKKLQSEEYQMKAATGLYDAVVTTLKENGRL